MIKIDKNIPVPDQSRGRGRKPKYPIPQMVPGDSFDAGRYTFKLQQNLVSAINRYKNYHKVTAEFVTRKTEDNRLRVWRTK